MIPIGVEGQIFTFFFLGVLGLHVFTFFPLFRSVGYLFPDIVRLYGSRPNLTTDRTVVEYTPKTARSTVETTRTVPSPELRTFCSPETEINRFLRMNVLTRTVSSQFILLVSFLGEAACAVMKSAASYALRRYSDASDGSWKIDR